ncbi:ABC transporter permease [Propionibacterium freudenreichii]|uniref:Transport permease protein n=1 Tax=Propionibacterium freudenreichii subsp. freudenreichii TaxID=66712 RepID=A0A0B7NZF8_PROFF|nr:ABC transporter permease [Propionibacterium freudenreichii]CEP26422.1 ABC-type polysaccharide export systems, permease component [Propionibacterium freudenreichii subsp. freudenreichii]MCT2984994.1 ABC transporter permease [Propionibacterium freudenreichii]MCT2987670.1 ABC transporter permease [Propionibacterium freudenreichii]MCT2996668.1 ABC transporter permease [Propionibacterium freudenreichii]
MASRLRARKIEPVSSSDLASLPLHAPGHSNGLLDVPKWHFLLNLLVKKELRVRYRGSVLGMLWSYVKPAVQLLVYYMAMGRFLRLSASMTNYVIYLFAGMVMINFFNEVMGNTTRSIVNNAPLVGKIYLPRELFPVSSLWVAFVHFVPQLAVLLLGALVVGWRPTMLNVMAGLLSIAMVAIFALGLGLAFAAWNVMFRDAENLVDLIAMVALWVSPVFYNWSMVQSVVPGWLWNIYQCNPLAMSVELSHYAFWVPTRGVTATRSMAELMPPHWVMWSGLALLISLIILVLGQMVFRANEGKFAQEL